MRIIAGEFGGRVIESPHGHRTHPMGDKIRGALFNTLGDITGLTVLDAFAGSGAIGFEALSRGAASVLALEHDPGAVRTIKTNERNLRVRQHKIVHAGVFSWSEQNIQHQFDIVIADPPYDELQVPTIHALVRHVSHKGLFVLSWPVANEAPEFTGLELVKHRSYGDASLYFYRQTS